jgi:hypothetical protein
MRFRNEVCLRAEVNYLHCGSARKLILSSKCLSLAGPELLDCRIDLVDYV